MFHHSFNNIFPLLFPYAVVFFGGCSCILFIHWYNFIFTPLCMIAFCCLFYSFIVSFLWSFACLCMIASCWVCVLCYLLGVWLSFLFLHGSFPFSNQKNCILLHLLYLGFSFRHTVVSFILPSFISFTQSNEWHFIVVI